jgi:ABC-2 type transport system ATP-binding protein
VTGLSPATAPALEARGLKRRLGITDAVAGLDLTVRPGELYGLVGPDGAGKTTALRLLVGLLVPDAGEARVSGVSVMSGGPGLRDALGYMPQQFSLYGDLSVAENLRFFADLFGLAPEVFRQREAELMQLTRLDRFRDRRASALSGGMYKKLALSCALLHRPRVLVLDEPTNGVDPVSRRELWDLLYELVDGGLAVLLATPYMDEAARCHRVGLMYAGRLLAEDSPAALVRGFDDVTWLVHLGDAADPGARDAAEARLRDRPEVRALSPQGGGLRVVVDRAGDADFRRFFAATDAHWRLSPVAPDFEDVFLRLVSHAS